MPCEAFPTYSPVSYTHLSTSSEASRSLSSSLYLMLASLVIPAGSRSVAIIAGVYADVFHNMVSENKIHITPRRGEYELLDLSLIHIFSLLPQRSRRIIFRIPLMQSQQRWREAASVMCAMKKENQNTNKTWTNQYNNHIYRKLVSSSFLFKS